MTNREWTSHVKAFSFTHSIPYMDALKSLECQGLYQKKNHKYEGIKQLREQQNDLVINYLNNKNITKQQFQKKYLEIEKKIKIKMEDSKRYRIKYKIKNHI